MILNNYIAIKRIRKLADMPLNRKRIFELHRILTEKTLEDPSGAGRFRRNNEPIRVYDDRDNEVLHNPPSADELPGRLKAMCNFANGKTPKYFIDPTIRSIILHFWLAYDHPFVDGNGRCARALFYWSMLRQGYWLCEFISISEIIKKAPSKYIRAFLFTETDDNDLTYFILYHLEVVRKAIDELHAYVTRKTDAVRQTERIMRTSSGFNHRQTALLSHALRHPDAEYTIKSHQVSHNIVQQTSRTDLLALVEKGLLVQSKAGRQYYFKPHPELENRLKQL
jgi:Fic family protein